jgi:serine/threonine protein kinase
METGGISQRCQFHTDDCIDARYVVEKRLGEGSFGDVFKVQDSSRKTYALKILKLWEVHPKIRRQLIDRFDMEYETGKIESRYLVQSVAHGFVKGNPYIVMEYCPNGDLTQWIGHLPPDFVRIARQVLYGLNDLHRNGKVHRDMKPENVLFTADRRAALTDFGISGDRNKRMTEHNILGKPKQIFGTYAYMPPEQMKPQKGDATVLPTTDIFSFGVMMYHLITGSLPFGKMENENDLALYIRRGGMGEWDRNKLYGAKMGLTFAKAIEGCLAPDFKNRLQTVDTVLQLLPREPACTDETGANAEQLGRAVNGYLLRVMHGMTYRQVYKLNAMLNGNSRILTLGRIHGGETDNSIVIPDATDCYVSRQHCTLEWNMDMNVWFVRDGQFDRSADGRWKRSANGTFVNSAEVSLDGRMLAVGDIITVGDTTLRIEGY